jgi:catechol 2,3-dioxygenase-like lactoylglutathione lyase family enzyme
MKLEDVVPMMTVTDLDETLHFYREILGFECVNRTEGWAVVQKDSVELMLFTTEQRMACAFTIIRKTLARLIQ